MLSRQEYSLILVSGIESHLISNLNLDSCCTQSIIYCISKLISFVPYTISHGACEGNLDSLKTFPVERRHQHHRGQLLLDESLQNVDSIHVIINLLSQFLHLLLSLLNSLSTGESLQGILNGSNLIVDISQLLDVSLGQTQRLELALNLRLQSLQSQSLSSSALIDDSLNLSFGQTLVNLTSQRSDGSLKSLLVSLVTLSVLGNLSQQLIISCLQSTLVSLVVDNKLQGIQSRLVCLRTQSSLDGSKLCLDTGNLGSQVLNSLHSGSNLSIQSRLIGLAVDNCCQRIQVGLISLLGYFSLQSSLLGIQGRLQSSQFSL